jgi:hypothetical protein
MKTEHVFMIGAEGGGLSISRQTGKAETKFIYNHNEFYSTDEGLHINNEYEFANFEEPFALINKYRWHLLYIVTMHDDYRNYIIEKLIEKLNSESNQSDFIEYNKDNMERILKIKLKRVVDNDDKPKWSFFQSDPWEDDGTY